MGVAFFIASLCLALAAALRSTWSPCGWSMLSTITPLSEAARGHRFPATAGWFIGGAALGGALLGAVGALGALGVHWLGSSIEARTFALGVASLLAAALDAGVIGRPLPHLRRQVNERWLDEFRPWVYAAGFGVQIGTGLMTYVMTGGVYVVLAAAALSAHLVLAISIGVVFGVVRGTAVLAGRHNVDAAALNRFHRRFAALEGPVGEAVTAVLATSAVVLGIVAFGAPPALVALPLVVLVVGAARALRVTATSKRVGSPQYVEPHR